MPTGPDWKHMSENSGQVLLDLPIFQKKIEIWSFMWKMSQFLNTGKGLSQFDNCFNHGKTKQSISVGAGCRQWLSVWDDAPSH